jgi:hypothetical protein
MLVTTLLAVDRYFEASVSRGGSVTRESAADALLNGRYKLGPTLNVDVDTGAEAAEEVFDLTNNPSRALEVGRTWDETVRPLRIGDVVCTPDGMFVCDEVGWISL